MNGIQTFPGDDQEDRTGAEYNEEKVSIGNNGGESESDFNPDDDESENSETSGQGTEGDDQRSGDNGINPLPGEIDPEKKAINDDVDIENADEDELNPYPDEGEPDNDDDDSPTWTMSGTHKKV